MPFRQVICDAPTYNRGVLPISSCLECAASRENTCAATYELLSSMFSQVQDRGEKISTTTLTNSCPRSEYLKRKVDYAEKPGRLYASFRGTMFHGQLETHAHPRAIAEARYHMELEGLGPFSCSPDLVDPVVGELSDYKFTKEVPRFEYPYDGHKKQVLINRWVVDNATHVEYQGETYDLTDHAVRWRFVPQQWNQLRVVYMDDKGAKPIIVTRSVEVETKAGGTKRIRVPDLGKDEVIEAFVREQYEFYVELFKSEKEPPIPEDFAYWDHPLCGFCPVKAECVERFITDAVEERVSA